MGGSIKKEGFLAHEKTKTQKKARNNIIKTKKLKKTSSVLDNNKNKQQIIPFRKKTKTKNLANKSVEKKNRFFRLPILVVNLIIILLMMHYSSYVLYDMKNENKKGKK